ncbi:hypothetical protein ACFPES_21575 [Paenibacillus sp. GCM10023248]|uniref:hypothetical protein n=1 Tax=Bacillus sp. 3255 TaxID=2817904 RepID=UPI00286D2F0C|nr:hypothetical protein [Bacillus sp. 3255]MDD9269648.1 hypothetical protein [Paenibacillus sp. MAHUQ-63]
MRETRQVEANIARYVGTAQQARKHISKTPIFLKKKMGAWFRQVTAHLRAATAVLLT